MTLYVESVASLKAQITKICNIIDALLDITTNGIGNVDLTNYSLDDGQVKIVKGITSPKQLADATFQYDQLKQTYINRLNGRQMANRAWEGLW